MASLIAEDYFNLDRAKKDALAYLSKRGFDASRVYGPDGACFALDVVRGEVDDFSDDPALYAAMILRHAREFELCAGLIADGQSGYWKRAAMHAYGIGRFVALGHVYRRDDADKAKRDEGSRIGNTKWNEADRKRWRELADPLSPTLSWRAKARIVAAKVSLPDSAIESIRQELMKKPVST